MNNMRSLITITGDSAERARLEELVKGEASDFDFNKILPMLDERAENGHLASWRRFVQLWGAEECAYCFEKTATSSELFYRIIGLYGTPDEMIEELSKRFPRLTFDVHTWCEQDGDEWGYKFEAGVFCETLKSRYSAEVEP